MLAGMGATGEYSSRWFTGQTATALLLATVLIGAYYPLTQIYQHGEDSERGDRTISVLLGVKGTMLFSGILFAVSFGIAGFYFMTYYTTLHLIIFLSSILPVGIYFITWWRQVMRDRTYADYRHAMLMTRLSSVCTVVCFIILAFLNHRIY